MESFFRYIAYVDYYKNGEKIKNVGFLRWKLHNDMHFMEIQIKDVDNIRGVYEIKEKNTQKILDEILIDKGIGSFAQKFSFMSDVNGTYIDTKDSKIYLYDMEGFIIWLTDNEYLYVDVKLEKEKGKNDIEIASENILIEGINEKFKEQKYQDIIEKPEIYNLDESEENNKSLTLKKGIKIIEPLHEDKWQQLCKEYPKVHPFSGKNLFLSVKPQDFIILQQEYQKLVHNSFLLHGFYNYGHMILGKLAEEKEAPIYIGVPGVYYEREKQAARMFGFVGFESTEQPVQSGSYGYYMIEVKI